MGEFYKKFGEGLCGFPKSKICGRKLWVYFSRNLERDCMGFQKQYWRRFAWMSKKQYWRKKTLGGNVSRNFERVCVDFQKAILAEGNYGGFF